MNIPMKPSPRFQRQPGCKTVALAALLFGLLTTHPGTAGAGTPPVRIMPLGDSITDGYPSSLAGYRYMLYQLLTSAGFNVDFVGNQDDNGTVGLPDWDHEGHSGYRIDQIEAGFPGWFNTISDPDIILLLIGTNDYGQNYDTADATNRMDQLIWTIVTNRPNAKLVVANVLQRSDNTNINNAIQTTFNPYLPGMVASHAALGQQVYFLNMCAALGLADLQDGLHPNQTGYNKMATNWFGEIATLITPLGTTNVPVISRVTGLPDRTHAVVTFSKPVTAAATNLANYSLSGGLAVLNATLDPVAQRDVTLTTSLQTTSQLYTVTVSNVRDVTPSHLVMAPGSTATFLSAQALASGYQAVMIDDLPVAYYPLDETNGTTAVDVVGGYNGAYQWVGSTVTLGVASVSPYLGTAVNFTPNARVWIGNPAALNYTSGQMTLEAWVKPTTNTSGWQYIISHGIDWTDDREVVLRINNGVYEVGPWYWDGSSWQDHAAMTVPAGDIGNWVHLVGTYDGANWNLYHNGALANTKATGGPIVLAGDWAIGGAGSAERFFAGAIDAAAIYNYTLSAKQIQMHFTTGKFGTTNPVPVFLSQPAALMFRCVGGTAVFSVSAASTILPLNYQWNQGGSPIGGATNTTLTLTNLQLSDAGNYSVTVTNATSATNSMVATLTVLGGYGSIIIKDQPLAYYPLNETSGTVAHDYANGNDGMFTNNPTLGVPGASAAGGTAMALSGQYIDISSNYAALNFSGQIALEAWIKPSSLYGYIIAHSTDGGSWDELWLQLDGNGNYICGTHWWDGTNWNHQVTVPVPAGTLSNWVHVVGTYDGANWNVYQNGVLLGSAAASGAIPIGCDWGIGSGTGLAYGRFFTGSIQDVAIYNYALTQNQIKTHFAASSPSALAVTTPGNVVTLTWPGGILQQADNVAGPFNDVSGATSPYHPPAGPATKFYRLRF